ncbi:YfbU family protein [Mycobacterium sp. pR1184]|uniref:YfbU family protein n=1 Tax=Mycobacterium sp. pR1184 TaxID=3238981 RepID=UPI00351BB913
MAVLNIRVEDRIRDQLKEIADAEGVTISEYVRDLVMAAIIPVYDERLERHGDEPAPETMRITDRQVLSLLHRILARVLPEDDDEDSDAKYHLQRARVIEAGFTGEYWREVAGFSTELSKRDCDRVLDTLQMFRVITYSVERLEKEGVTVSEELRRQLEFRGFDYNDGLEGHMASYVKHLMSDGRWAELQPQVRRRDDGNSHYRVLDTYMRMLAEHRRIMDTRSPGFDPEHYLLSVEELEQIAAARAHSSRHG